MRNDQDAVMTEINVEPWEADCCRLAVSPSVSLFEMYVDVAFDGRSTKLSR